MNGNPVLLTTTTDENGAYLFTGLYSGVYEVSYINSSVYVVDSAQAGTTTGTTVTSKQLLTTLGLQAGEASVENDFGLIELGSIAGTVYYDMSLIHI